jgi:hypothetical protein
MGSERCWAADINPIGLSAKPIFHLPAQWNTPSSGPEWLWPYRSVTSASKAWVTI